jgi:uncharacterized Ntn-hydrolase superfamily protein
MTFSIVARSSDGLATQSYANVAYRPQGLTLLRTQVGAADVVAGLTAADAGRDQRQVGVVGRFGEGSTFTGSGCHSWAGGLAGDGYAVQGNILAGPQVVERMREAFLASEKSTPGDSAMALARRLVAALRAGDEAGGDSRGRQSAALLVVAPGAGYGGTSDVAVDLRIDDHSDPCAELERLLGLHALLFEKADPDTLLDLSGPLADEVRGLLARRGHTQDDVNVALADWAGIENLEERITPGKIDPLVLAHLRD